MSNTTTVPTGSRHPVNIGHLVMGLAFAGLLAVWALIVGDAVDGDDIRWLLPLPWVFAGAIGLLAVTLASRRRRPAPSFAEPTHATETTNSTEKTDMTDTEEIR
jgi:hypothetical protein